LIAKIEAAAKRGEFTEPRKRSALDLLEALEKLEPGSPEGAQLRRRIAHLLEGAGDRLWAGKMIVSARTLYREALLFTPDNDRLARLAYPAASDIAGRQRQIAARAKARRQRKAAAARKRVSDAKIAWLVSEVQRAVAEGRYLAPSGRSAFAYLERLKLLDPTGKRSAEARRLIHETMKQEAERKWRGGQRAEARKMYQVIKQLHPEDRVARARAAGGDVQGNGSGSGSAGALAPRRKADRAQLEKLVKEGHALLRQGKPQQAEASFLAAMRLRPRYAPAIAGLATAKFERGKYMQAVEFAERALRINRRRKRTLMLLGDANYRLLRYRDALAAWQRVLALEPGHKRAAQRIAMLKKRHP
ncbi:MAG: hypothetical protein KC503_28570, partial [Myxococcales bacterium]|nr:hypothetical protein [Myxococcales bacterium]